MVSHDIRERAAKERSHKVENVAIRRSGQGRLSLNRSALTKRTELSIKGIVPIETWREIGEQIFLISDSSTWWIGDWLVYGQLKYPERYKRAIAETSLDYQTLRNYAWVARRFEASRRRENLSFQHHVEVAALSEEEQDRWLDQAEHFGWSRNELRAQVRAARRGETQPNPVAATIQVDVSVEQRTLWEHAADLNSRNLGEWIQLALDEAARNVLSASNAGEQSV